MYIGPKKNGRDMGSDLDRRATEAVFQLSAHSSLLCLRHPGLTALPAVKGKRIPALLQVGFMPAPDRVAVQIQANRNFLPGFSVVEQQDPIYSMGNTVVLALMTHVPGSMRSAE